MKTLHPLKSASLALLLVGLASSAAMAQSTWLGSGSITQWNTAGNWDPSGVPALGANVIVNTTAASTVVVNTGSVSVGNWTSSSTGATATVTASGNRTLGITGTLTKTGTSTLLFRGNGAASTFGVTLNNLDLTATGAGVVNFGGAGTDALTGLSIATATVSALSGTNTLVFLDAPNASNYTIGNLTLGTNGIVLMANELIASNYNLNVGSLNGTSGIVRAANSGSATGTATLNLTGTSAGSFAGAIQNGPAITAVHKSGAATQTLTSAGNSYTGQTTISAGTLLLSGAGNLPNTSGFQMRATDTENGLLTVNNTTFTAFAGNLILDISTVTLTTGSWTLFNGTGFGVGDLNFSGVTSNLVGLTLADDGFGVWSGIDATSRTWTFSEDLGTLNVIPEPTTWVLLALGLSYVMVMRRRNPRVS